MGWGERGGGVSGKRRGRGLRVWRPPGVRGLHDGGHPREAERGLEVSGEGVCTGEPIQEQGAGVKPIRGRGNGTQTECRGWVRGSGGAGDPRRAH